MYKFIPDCTSAPKGLYPRRSTGIWAHCSLDGGNGGQTELSGAAGYIVDRANYRSPHGNQPYG